jgi:general stress protein YciG
MAGTKLGGQRAAAKNLARDPDFYAKIGKLGGERGRTGGFATRTPCYCNEFAYPHQKQNCAGKKGGRISRRRRNDGRG